MLPNFTQNQLSRIAHVIMMTYSSEGELAALATNPNLAQISDVIGYTTEVRLDLNGIGVMQLSEFDPQPSDAINGLAEALSQAPNYVTAINNSAPYMRYLPDHNEDNVAAGAFFKTQFFNRTGLGVARWVDLVADVTDDHQAIDE